MATGNAPSKSMCRHFTVLLATLFSIVHGVTGQRVRTISMRPRPRDISGMPKPFAPYEEIYIEPIVRTNEFEDARYARSDSRLLASDDIKFAFYAYRRRFNLQLSTYTQRTINKATQVLIHGETGAATEKPIGDFGVAYVNGVLEGDDESYVHGFIRDGDGSFQGVVHSGVDSFYIERGNPLKLGAAAHRQVAALSANGTLLGSIAPNTIIYRETDVRAECQEEIEGMLHHKKYCVVEMPDGRIRPLEPWEAEAEPESEPSNWEPTAAPEAESETRRARSEPLLAEKMQSGLPEGQVCNMTVIADYDFYVQICKKDVSRCAAEMIWHIAEADFIFRRADFSGEKVPDNNGFAIERIVVFQSRAAADYPMRRTKIYVGDDDSLAYIDHVTKLKFRDTCLVMWFNNYRFFPTLGIAYVQGLCDRGGYNQGMVTFKGENSVPLPRLITSITVAHEIGHLWGADHDRNEPVCTPGGRRGNYLMYAYAPAGTKPNNRRFSHCSIQQINDTLRLLKQTRRLCLEKPRFDAPPTTAAPESPTANPVSKAGSPDIALDDTSRSTSDSSVTRKSKLTTALAARPEVTTPTKTTTPSPAEHYCGDSSIDTHLGERCDCGPTQFCNARDSCCNAADVANACQLRTDARCAATDACCSRDTCTFAPKSTQCRAADECSQAAMCTGTSHLCPKSIPKEDGLTCANGARLCLLGQCAVSRCETLGMRECECDDRFVQMWLTGSGDRPSRVARRACELCCFDTKDHKCRPAIEIDVNKSIGSMRLYQPVDSGCMLATGVCRSFPDPDSPNREVRWCVEMYEVEAAAVESGREGKSKGESTGDESNAGAYVFGSVALLVSILVGFAIDNCQKSGAVINMRGVSSV